MIMSLLELLVHTKKILAGILRKYALSASRDILSFDSAVSCLVLMFGFHVRE